MRDWTDEYQDWEGTAAQLADAAAAIAAEIGISEQKGSESGPWLPNERLVRHYVHVEILDKPIRKGKEAYFGFRQIVQLLVSRVLLNEGWLLAKIGEVVRLEGRTGLDGLLAMLPKSMPRTPAQELVSKFQRSARDQASRSAPPPSDAGSMRRSIDLLKQRQEAFPDGMPPEVETWLHIKLTPWCHVYIERDAARVTSPELIERLSRALTQSLIEFIRKGDRK